MARLKFKLSTPVSIICFLSLGACASIPRADGFELCRTTCGMMAVVPDHKTCTALQDYEDNVIWALRNNVKGYHRRKPLCRALKGWNITVHVYEVSDPCKSPSWSDPNLGPGKFCIVGHTDEDTRTLEVNTYDWMNSTLAHEMVHALDSKFYGPYHGHCDWKVRGVDEALLELTGSDAYGSNNSEDCKGTK